MLIQINKKLYVIFLILLFVIFGYFLVEVQRLNEKSDLYARQNLFHEKVDFNDQKFYFLDGYSTSLDFQTIPYCNLIQYYPLITFKQIAYRYPSALTIAKYWLFSQNQQRMVRDAEQLRHAYVLLTKSGQHTFNNKVCN
ncbi:MAG: hypothetical protein LKF82_08695 [Acinetobacter populi]|jgi:hypothetical protein|uniref:hypothetical protein n=1 Tax=Acinetobacter populi TaxID=1582270 RepID=UPI002352F728|nr:hypothetical protein [Acinetobacter populi]MCH4247902.1 hypothetical protein [Acinetobacter populi]